ncbi:MAG: 4Fe-4S binding protein [Armatimonadetes bacterium]|nr:4Fe-4S binding protein [Candidatus Hippobium faecium]
MGEIVIDREKCKGCGLCVHFCPKKCISMDTEINVKGYKPAVFSDSGKCIGCAICATMCPDVCIEVWKDVK